MHYAKPPVLLHDVIPDHDAVVRLLVDNAPYMPLGGWFRSGNQAEVATLPLWFQKDWVHAELMVPGAELFLHHPRVIDAAKGFYDADVIVPHTIYVNVMGPTAAHGPAHTDNPVFRGLGRTNTPMHLLRAMLWSGLFDDWAITQATSIWWMNDVDGGGLLYWPDGPTAPPARHDAPMANTALVGDNHGMFHQVAPIGGDRDAPLVSSSAEVGPTATGEWAVVDGGREVWRAPLDHYRVSVLWKAHVYANDAERRRVENDLLTLADVVDIFNDDLARRDDPLRLACATVAEMAVREELRRAYPEAVPVGAGPTA
jgi:hypothetical protein